MRRVVGVETMLRPSLVCVLMAAALAVLPLSCSTGGAGPDAGAQARFLQDNKFQGRVVFIEFGLLGCQLSEAGLEKMMQLDRGKEVPDLAYVRVEVTPDKQAADAYYAAKSPGFLVVRDPDSSLGKAFGATVWPSFVLVDKFGHVRYRGPLPEDAKLSDWADALQREKTDPGPSAPMFGLTTVDVRKLLDETRLPDLKGATKPLRQYLGPKGLLAVFVDTNCPFSGEAVGDMSKVAATLAKHDVPAILVNISEPEAAVRQYYAQKQTGTPVIYDVTAATQKSWQIDAVPTVVLFDGGGGMVYRGKAVWRDLATAAESALKLPAGSINFGVKGTEFG